MLFASYSPCIESQRLRRMETRRLGVRSKQRAIGISDQRAQSTHLALRAALLVIDHTNKFGCFNHKVHHGGTPWALLIVEVLPWHLRLSCSLQGVPPLGHPGGALDHHAPFAGHLGAPQHLMPLCILSNAHVGRRPSPLAVRRHLYSLSLPTRGGAHARLEGVGAITPVSDPPSPRASADLARCSPLWLSMPLARSLPTQPPRS